MNYNRTQRGERLAADYVLGMMPPRARRRFERAMATSATLAATVAAWSDRLAPLDTLTAEEAPPARVWRAIDQRIGDPRIAPASRTRRAPPQRGSGFFWRGFGAIAVVACAAVVIYVAINPAQVNDMVAELTDKTGLSSMIEAAKNNAAADIGLSTIRLGVPERERPRWLRAALLLTDDAVPLTGQPPKPPR
jgi:anti-sigma-K factor RskA